jgi:hypothetical protein
MKRSGAFKASDLVLVGLDQHWNHAMDLLRLANDGVPEARELAELTLDGYFRRLNERTSK